MFIDYVNRYNQAMENKEINLHADPYMDPIEFVATYGPEVEKYIFLVDPSQREWALNMAKQG